MFQFGFVFLCVCIHNLSKEVAVAPGAVGEGGPSAEPAAVWDDDVIHVREEGVSLGQDHGVQAVRARLLHALNDKLHIHWQLLVDRKEDSATPLDPIGSKWQWQQVVGMEDELVEENLIWKTAQFWMTSKPFWKTGFADSKIMSH